MKSIYILNLDLKRILLIAGCAVIIIIIAFVTGRKSLEQDLNQLLADINITNKPLIISEEEIVIQPKVNSYQQPAIIEKSPFVTQQQAKVNKPRFNVKPIKTIHPAPVQIDNTPKPTHKIKNKPNTPATKKTVTTPKPLSKKESTSNLASQKSYTIQLGAFKRESDANRYLAQLKKKNIHAMIVRGVIYYLVCIESSNNRKSLQPKLKKISKLIKEKPFIAYRKLN